jgi:alginate O-acetyltransferase complex protein AlgJ
LTNRLLVLLFLIVIGLPLGANIAGRDGADPQAENRELAAAPHYHSADFGLGIADYGLQISAWFEDHFGFRSTLVRWYGESRYFWLGVSPSAAVIAGRDGWLFYGDDGGAEDYANETPLSAPELADWRETLVRTETWLHARSIAFIFTIAPDKPVIYPEEFPSSIRRIRETSRMDQVEQILAPTAVPVVDVRPALRAAKAIERVYFLTDTHWNNRGAFVAYQQIIDAVRRQAPAVPPAWTRADFEPAERLIDGQDLARMIGLMRVLHETDLYLRPRRPRLARVIEPPGAEASAEEGRLVTEIPGSTLPRAVIFRDSFASALAPFLSEHFSRAVYLWQNDFDADAVSKERPDVVIQEIVGRHLYGFAPSPELIPH